MNSSHRPSYRTVRTFVTLGLVAIALVIIGVINLFKPADQSNTSHVATDAKAVCSDGAHLDAPAYTAGTNQPLALYARSGTADGQIYNGVYVLGTAPVGTALHDAYTTVGRNLTETHSANKTPVLVGCITRSNETVTGQKCTYSDGASIPVYDTSYQLTVYEAKTHNKIITTNIATQDYACSSFTTYDGKGFYRAWSPTEVALALRPL